MVGGTSFGVTGAVTGSHGADRVPALPKIVHLAPDGLSLPDALRTSLDGLRKMCFSFETCELFAEWTIISPNGLSFVKKRSPFGRSSFA